MTVNEITIAPYWHGVDNADELQRIMYGSKYYWIADLTKGYWQIELDEESR